MRISDWSSDVCSSDLLIGSYGHHRSPLSARVIASSRAATSFYKRRSGRSSVTHLPQRKFDVRQSIRPGSDVRIFRSEEHTSELQSLMRISYAVFCLKKKKHTL